MLYENTSKQICIHAIEVLFFHYDIKRYQNVKIRLNKIPRQMPKYQKLKYMQLSNEKLCTTFVYSCTFTLL